MGVVNTVMTEKLALKSNFTHLDCPDGNERLHCAAWFEWISYDAIATLRY